MSRGSQRDMLQSKAKGNRLRIMYPLDLKSVAYESEYISTGNISRNISFRLPYLCAIFLKCLFTLRCTRKAKKGRASLPVAGLAFALLFSLETSTLLRSSIQARANLCFFLPLVLCLALIYRAPPIRAKILYPSSKYNGETKIAL